MEEKLEDMTSVVAELAKAEALAEDILANKQQVQYTEIVKHLPTPCFLHLGLLR